jgi:hypothetical protein
MCRNEFDVLVDRVKQLTSDHLVSPILDDFMQNCFNKKVLQNDQSIKSKTMTLDSNIRQKVAKERSKKGFSLKKIAKLSKKSI